MAFRKLHRSGMALKKGAQAITVLFQEIAGRTEARLNERNVPAGHS
jgi:hypothetical protein